MRNSCQFSKKIYHTLSTNLKQPCIFANFQGLVQIEAIPYPYCFDLIGLLWSGDLNETSELQNTVSFRRSRFSSPNMENIGRAQPALQCCTLHSLERDHTQLWSNIESKVQNELKAQDLWHIWVEKCTTSVVNFPEKSSYFIRKTQKTLCFCIFARARSNRSNS